MSPTQDFAAKFADKHGLDITTIISIITAIAKMFENCPKPEKARAQVKNPGIFAQVAATRIVMDELDQLSRREARRLAQNLIADAAAEDDATVEAVCSECMSGTFASFGQAL